VDGEVVQNIRFRYLRPPKVPLRPLDTQSVRFLELRDSIRDHGLLNPITVRPIVMSPGMYEVVLGYHRYTICEMLGHETVACIVKKLKDAEVLALQIQENAISIPTKPVEYAKHLKRIQSAYPKISMSEMARVAGKSTLWIKQQLTLTNLIDAAQIAVDRDEVPMSSAYMLAKIPRNYQRGFLTQARTFSPKEFKELAANFIRKVMESRRTGQLRNHFLKEFEAQPYMRALKVLLSELATNTEGSRRIAKKAGRKTALDGWRMALQWVMHLDEDSIEKQKRAAIERQQKQTIEREAYVNEIDTDVPDSDSSDSAPSDSQPESSNV